MPAIIEIQDLVKRYNRLTAVDGLSLKVEQGEIFGFVGPNGAGKTSTIRILAGLLKPTSGELQIGGHSVLQEPRKVRSLIGYMPDYFGVYRDMTVGEYLDFFGACYFIPKIRRAQITLELLDLVDLAHRQDDPVDKLSRGMKQRLSLARTLVHDPQVLILDEPASGLDPRARVEIREQLLELSHLGKTIFFSTHILSDVSEICSRVGIIEAGKLVAVGTLEELQTQLTGRRKVEIGVLDRISEAEQLLSDMPGVLDVQSFQTQNGGRSRLEINFSGDDTALTALLARLVSAEIPVVHFSEDQRDLEDVFMRITKGDVT